MRLIFAFTFVLSLPVLVVAHRLHYTRSLHGPLLGKAATALESHEFAQVNVALHYMDVTLKGRVADLTTREKARALVDDIRGLRCREQDNLIQVTAKLNATLAKEKLLVTGWLHDETTLRDASRWLATARPGIEVVTDGVQISPHVTIETAPGGKSGPAAFRGAWSAIEVPASLKIVREGAMLVLSGHLPDAALKDAVISAVTGEAGSASVDAAQLASGPYVRHAKFAAEQILPNFLKAFFSTPGATRFEANVEAIQAIADATPTMQREWLELLEPVAREAKLKTQFRVFPSVYHFPGHVRESKASAEAFAALQDVLRASVINFAPGYVTPDPAEQPKLDATASALIAAGPEIRILAGGHADLIGNPKDNVTMARRRAERVVADLVDKGVAPQVVTAAVFEAVPGDADHSRQVEFLIK